MTDECVPDGARCGLDCGVCRMGCTHHLGGDLMLYRSVVQGAEFTKFDTHWRKTGQLHVPASSVVVDDSGYPVEFFVPVEPTIPIDKYGQTLDQNTPHFLDLIYYFEEVVDRHNEGDDNITWSRIATDVLRIINGEDRDYIIEQAKKDA